MRRCRLAARVAAAALVAGSVATAAGAAGADATVPYTDDGALPWASGAAHQGPLEVFASALASRATGREGREVRCEGQTDWDTLAAQHDFDPRRVLGYVAFTQKTSNGIAVGDPVVGHLAEFAPVVCDHLNRFALAGVKPTTCRPLVREEEVTTRLVTVTRQERKAVWKVVPVTHTVRVVKNGVVKRVVKTTKKRVQRWVSIPVEVVEEVKEIVVREVEGEPVPCYRGESQTAAAPMSAAYWQEYGKHVTALRSLAHELEHLTGETDESRAECYGAQMIEGYALAFGSSPGDAQAIVDYYWAKLYPALRHSDYWTVDCRDGGPLDRRPESGAWPS